jgi:hypothetical protein
MLFHLGYLRNYEVIPQLVQEFSSIKSIQSCALLTGQDIGCFYLLFITFYLMGRAGIILKKD